MWLTFCTAGNQPSDRHQRLLQTSLSSLSGAAGENLEIEQRERLDDTYVGIIVGTLAVFIVLIVAVSLIIAFRFRRKKHGGGSAGSPSKFIYSRGVMGNGGSCRNVESNAAEKSLMMKNGTGLYNTIIVDIDDRPNKEISLSDKRVQYNGPGNGVCLPATALTTIGELFSRSFVALHTSELCYEHFCLVLTHLEHALYITQRNRTWNC